MRSTKKIRWKKILFTANCVRVGFRACEKLAALNPTAELNIIEGHYSMARASLTHTNNSGISIHRH
jgi:hypothetical protein